MRAYSLLAAITKQIMESIRTKSSPLFVCWTEAQQNGKQ